MNRREFLLTGGAATLMAATPPRAGYKTAVKYRMIQTKGSVADKFKLLRTGELDAPLRQAVRSSTEIGDALKRASAPRRFDELDEPIPAATARAAIYHAHLLRARFTFGDLLDRGGRLTDEAPGELLAALDHASGR